MIPDSGLLVTHHRSFVGRVGFVGGLGKKAHSASESSEFPIYPHFSSSTSGSLMIIVLISYQRLMGGFYENVYSSLYGTEGGSL